MGMSDLAATVSRQTPPLGTPMRLPLTAIDLSPLNPRKRFDPDQLQDLAASLAADGQLQPVVVRPGPYPHSYILVAGERRWRAAERLGWAEIDAIVRADIDERTQIRLALLENLARTDLDPLEEAGGYQQLIDLGMTQDAIAEAVHRSRSAVANSLRLLKAPPEVRARMQEVGANGKPSLAPSHVLALLKYEAFPPVMIKAAELAAEHRTRSKALEGGTPALNLRSLKYGQYERVDYQGVPKGCSPKCECRRAAVEGRTTVQICVKPTRLRELRDAQRKAEEAARRERQEQLAQACGHALEQVDRVRSRELALLAVHALTEVRGDKQLDQILVKHAPAFKARGKRNLDDLAALEPVQLIRIAVEGLLASDLEEMRWGRHAAYAAWYAGPLPKQEKADRPSRQGKRRIKGAAEVRHDPDPRFEPGDLVRLPNGDVGEVQHEISGFVEVLVQDTGEPVSIGREVLTPIEADPPSFDPDAHPGYPEEIAAKAERLQAEAEVSTIGGRDLDGQTGHALPAAALEQLA